MSYTELRVIAKGETLYRGQNCILYQDINMLLNGVKLGLWRLIPFCRLVVIRGTTVFFASSALAEFFITRGSPLLIRLQSFYDTLHKRPCPWYN